MSRKLYIGIDNGTTGSIAFLGEATAPKYMLTPTFKEQSYTKKKQEISRIDHAALKEVIREVLGGLAPEEVLVIMERPRINPMQFRTSISAARSLEATLCVIEDLGLPRMYCDSRDWQKELLPKGTTGTPELKKASADIGRRLFPSQADLIARHKDADALLIAEWARRKSL